MDSDHKPYITVINRSTNALRDGAGQRLPLATCMTGISLNRPVAICTRREFQSVFVQPLSTSSHSNLLIRGIPMEFETDRLLLRKWTESDSEVFTDINSDPSVMRYFPSVYSRERSNEMMQLCNAEIEQYGFGFWAVERKDSKAMIGFVGLHNFDADLDFCPCVEIGRRLAQSQWGNGFATEAANATLKIGFSSFDLESIFSFTALSNLRSRAVMKRIGMADTMNNFAHPQVPAESGLQEHCLYKISKVEWLQMNY